MIRWICVVLGFLGGGLTVLLMIQEDEEVRKVTPMKEKPEQGENSGGSMYKGSLDSDVLEEINKG